jgi:hypothetical protein
VRDRINPGRAIAVLACAAALVGTATVLAPASASAHGATSCGSKTIAVPVKGRKAVRVPISRISVEGGATCAEAYAVIRGSLVKKLPAGWTVGPGHFTVPHGLTAQTSKKGKKVVNYATVGGTS